ncbi:polysaccharide biosynthesis tyrosine autokinase [Arthrobacter sp. zg-Y238]|uniref:polysaccharide biosynthesis tyrosine autokinase n=1 Tax=Arthrobacter sp. zg-Y238 TaxID=2964614 RepID=UPI002102A314|nr:polysaccharide biosynthesis tyrosine autokinase [Arthrobacter sp. zg-Y238]MCQ1954391.1 polysaccharide biosynthesis tyrosine autokinase [Arthrobacter sp. zg-Y238]
MQLNEYVRILRRQWTLVVVASCLGLLSAAGITLVSSPTYTANTRLFVAIQNSGAVSELQQGNTFSQGRVKSYVETVKTPAVLQPAIDELGLDIEPVELLDQVRASADLDTVLISIAVDDDSPVQAAALAQAIANSLIEQVETLERPAEAVSSPVRLSIVTPAVAPESPSGPNMGLNLVIGIFLGLLAGLVSALIRSSSDTRVRSENDLSSITKAPVLGGVAFDGDASKKPLLTQAGHQSPRAESFRHIRTNLQFANVSSKSKTMLVTSSLPGEGKSTTATNLAIAMAQDGQRVVLIDADLRRPMVAEYLGLEGRAGLTTALVGSADVMDLLQPWGEQELYVLSSGRVPPNPSELLGSNAMATLIRKLESNFDVVIIDAPPLIPVTDATVLAQKGHGVVLVVGAGKVRTHDVEKSLESLNLVGADLLGVVVNLLPTKGPDAYAYSYYSYASKPDSHRKSRNPAKAFNGSHMKAARRSKKPSRDSDHAVGGRR